jgi:hypothetical protein
MKIEKVRGARAPFNVGANSLPTLASPFELGYDVRPRPVLLTRANYPA